MLISHVAEKLIIIIYGDYIPEDSNLPAGRFWRAGLGMAYGFEDPVNSMGGDCTVIYLPDNIAGYSMQSRLYSCCYRYFTVQD